MKSILLRVGAFFCAVCILLGGLSALSLEMNRKQNPFYNYDSRGIFAEVKESVDVLAIGTSDVYSGICPLQWWESDGITGYAWGEASQRLSQTYEYLKDIYRSQTPQVVFLEVGALFTDRTTLDNLNSMTAAKLADFFPIFCYHRNLRPSRLSSIGTPAHSLTKGYFPRLGVKSAKKGEIQTYMAASSKETTIHPFSRETLENCIALCQKNGSAVVLLSIPCCDSWTQSKSNAVSALAREWDLPFLDLNNTLKETIDWHTDSPDGGEHLNVYGAEKVTTALGDYLRANFTLPDHRQDEAYTSWQTDSDTFFQALQEAKEGPTT